MRMITDFFSEPGQSALRNALEAASLILAILHSHPSRRRAKRRERKRRGAAEHGREPEQAAGEGRDAVTAASRVTEHQPQAIRMPLSSRPSPAIPSQRRIAATTLPPHTVTARTRDVETRIRANGSRTRGPG